MELTRRACLAGAGGLFGAVCGFGSIQSASGSDELVTSLGGPAFGSYWRATLPRGRDEARVRRRIEAVIETVDQKMSPFRAGSEISRFNQTKSTKPHVVSGDFHEVVSESLRIADLSGGAFDPTVGPLVHRYGFGPIRGDDRASVADIAIGRGTIRKARPSATLDLCGIAKGYALDRIVTAFGVLGIEDYVVELGGEVFARGSHPEGRAWRVAIEAPIQSERSFQRIVQLDGYALATSGDKANGYAVADRRYSHIIDARRSVPADGGIASVSVIGRSAMRADAFATAVMALGPERGLAFASAHNVPTLVLLRDGKGFRERTAAGFRDHILI